jgi:hypothetical protein
MEIKMYNLADMGPGIEIIIRMPVGAQILDVQSKGLGAMKWFPVLFVAVHQEERRVEDRSFIFYFNGQEIADNKFKYLRTVQLHQDGQEFHFFEVITPKKEGIIKSERARSMGVLMIAGALSTAFFICLFIAGSIAALIGKDRTAIYLLIGACLMTTAEYFLDQALIRAEMPTREEREQRQRKKESWDARLKRSKYGQDFN